MCFVDTWEVAQAKRVGREVQRLRGKRSAAWLASRADELGLKLTRQTIADLESGRRRYVTTAELIILAAALDTSPIVLIYPGPYSDVIEVWPGVQATEIQAAEWFCAERPGFPSAGDSGAEVARQRTEHLQNVRSLTTWRRIEEMESRRSSIVVPKGGALTDEQRDQLDFYASQIEYLKSLVGEHA